MDNNEVYQDATKCPSAVGLEECSDCLVLFGHVYDRVLIHA